MDIPSNKPRKDWDDLLAAARQARPPEDIDVRDRVMRALRNEAAPAPARRAPGLWEELSAMAGSLWLRGLVGGGALAACAFAVYAAQAGREMLDIVHLAGPSFTGF